MDKVIDKTTGFHFTIIDNYILDSEELDGMEQITYTHLKKYASSSDECFPGNLTLCKKLKCSKNTVRKILKSLETKGFISIQQRFNDSNRYELLPFPEFVEEAKETEVDEEKALMGSVLNFYQSNINQKLSSMERATLISWFEKFKENSELIIKVIGIAVSENVKKLSYIEAILEDWHKAGIITVQQAESYIKLRAEKRNSHNSKKEDTFTNYEQRKYDYNDLEKKLLGWNNDDEVG